jgi:hypothetical protein
MALARPQAHHEGMDKFEAAWNRIEAHAGKEFRTKTGLPFSYKVIGANVIPDRTGYPLHVSNFRTAFDLLPLSGPGQINAIVRGPAYVYAILADRRIVP